MEFTASRIKISGEKNSRSWVPILKTNDPNSLKDYLENNKVTLTVPSGLQKDAFRNARHEAFLNAAKAWNDLDESRMKRILIPCQVEPEAITFPPQPCVAKPPDRDSDSDVYLTRRQSSDSEEESSHP